MLLSSQSCLTNRPPSTLYVQVGEMFLCLSQSTVSGPTRYNERGKHLSRTIPLPQLSDIRSSSPSSHSSPYAALPAPIGSPREAGMVGWLECSAGDMERPQGGFLSSVCDCHLRTCGDSVSVSPAFHQVAVPSARAWVVSQGVLEGHHDQPFSGEG